MALTNIGRTGIVIGSPSGQPGAIDSGPYSNISYSAANGCNGSVCPACVDIEAQTRGVHGITCLGDLSVSDVSTAPGHAAVYVNASNNSVEDVHIEGFWDGIQIGDTSTSVGNILVANVTAGHSKSGPVVNAVHICGPSPTEKVNGVLSGCTTHGSLSDISVLQVTDGNGGKCTTLGTVVVLLAWFSVAPTRAEAQCTYFQGSNAVYGNCSGSVGPQGTYAFIDASQYQSQGDICQAMKAILNTFNTNYANGVVVDARGFPLPQGQNAYPCSVNPWNNSPQPSNNVVLLPSGTITLQTTWTLPTNTRITGQGPNVTILQAASGFAGSDVVNMGTTNGSTGLCDGQSPPYCAGIGIEHLALAGYGTNTTNGIVNCCSQELSYVNDVILTNLGGTGLLLQGNAGNSGPYSKISFSGSGICTQVLGPTRGIHGLSCVDYRFVWRRSIRGRE